MSDTAVAPKGIFRSLRLGRHTPGYFGQLLRREIQVSHQRGSAVAPVCRVLRGAGDRCEGEKFVYHAGVPASYAALHYAALGWSLCVTLFRLRASAVAGT